MGISGAGQRVVAYGEEATTVIDFTVQPDPLRPRRRRYTLHSYGIGLGGQVEGSVEHRVLVNPEKWVTMGNVEVVIIPAYEHAFVKGEKFFGF